MVSESKYYIYLHSNPSNGDVFYVGRGCDGRDSSHHGRSSYWRKIVKKYGFFIDRVITGLSNDQANYYEKAIIAGLRDAGVNLTNLTDGGDGLIGLIFTDVHKDRISKAKLGRPFTEEHKAKLAKAKLGKKRGPHSEEHKRRLSESKKGVCHNPYFSPEARKKISDTHKGKKYTLGHKRTPQQNAEQSERIRNWWAKRKQNQSI